MSPNMLSYVFLAALLTFSCLADDDIPPPEVEDNSTEEVQNITANITENITAMPPPTVLNSTTYNRTTGANDTIVPVVILVEDNRMKSELTTDSDYAARNLNWLVVRKITNITVTKESSVDPETKVTRDVVTENRAEEYRMFHDDRHRSLLSEKDVKTLPFPMRFL